MKKFTIPLFLLFSFTLLSQERISNILGDGNNENYLFTEFNNEKYVIKYNQFDSLKVYKYVDNSFQFQHSIYVLGISQHGFIFHSTNNRFLRFYLSLSFKYYDFVNNEMLSFVNGQFLTSIDAYDDNNAIFTVIDSTGENIFYNCDLTTDSFQLLSQPYYYKDQNSSHYLLQKNDSTYIIEDKTTHLIEPIEFPFKNNYHYLLYDDQFIYFNENKIHSYNFHTQSLQEVYDFNEIEPYKVQFKDYGTFYMARVFIKHKDEQLLFFDQTNNYLYSLTTPYSSQDPIKFKNGVIVNEYIDLNYYDFNTGHQFLTITSANEEDVLVFKDRYVLHKLITEFVIYDIEQDTTYFSGVNAWYGNQYFQYFDLGNKILLNYSNNADGYKELYDLDLNKMTIVESTSILNDISGLEKESKIQKVNNDLFMLAKNLYFIDDDETILLNRHNSIQNVNNQNYTIINNQLHWVEKSETTFDMCRFINGQKEIYFSYPSIPTAQFHIPLNISNYYHNDNFTILFTRGIESKVYLGNNSTGEIQEINDATNHTLQDHIISFENYLYTVLDNKVYRIDQNFEFLEIGDLGNSFLSSFILFQNELYLESSNAFYKINNDQLVEILSDLDFAIVEYIGDYILISDFDKYYIYDGGNITTNPSDFDNSGYRHFYKDIFVTYSSTGIPNEFLLKFKNIKTNTEYDLPDFIEDKRAVSLFKFHDKYILITTNTVNAYEVEVYETDSLFSNFSFLKSFYTADRNLQPVFINYGNEGLLYAGTEIFLMDDQLNFVHLNLRGDHYSNDVEFKDGYFYFKGIDPTLGRQVYRVQVFSQRVSTNDPASNNKQLLVYPNPTANELTVTNNTGAVALFNTKGNVILKGKNTLDLSKLNPGYYILRDEEGKSAKIIKN